MYLKIIWKIAQSKLFLLVLILFALIALWNLWGRLQEQKKETIRWEENYKTSEEEKSTFIDQNGRLVSENGILRFTTKELQSSQDSLIRQMNAERKAAGIKLRRVEGMAATQQTINQELNLALLNKQELIDALTAPQPINSKPTGILVGNFSDAWTNAKIYYNYDKWLIIYQAKNTIYTSVYWKWKPKKFLGLKWNWLLGGQKIYRSSTKETNPNIKSTVQIVEIVKK